MAANKNHKGAMILLRILFGVYLLLLFYFLFFAENMGRGADAAGYRYNLTLFREIGRFVKYREIVGYKSFFLNVFGNIIAFVPFGLLMPRLSPRTKNWFFLTLLAFALSLSVEGIQLVFRLGCFDVDDLLLNTIGGWSGYVIYYWTDRSKKKHVSV